MGEEPLDLDAIEKRWRTYQAFADRRGRAIVKDDARQDVAALIAENRALRERNAEQTLSLRRAEDEYQAALARFRRLEERSGRVEMEVDDLRAAHAEARQNVENLTALLPALRAASVVAAEYRQARNIGASLTSQQALAERLADVGL